MTTSEPTTGELVEFLRSEPLIAHRQCADRLESQERAIAEKDAQIEAQGKEMVRRDTVIKELTARAEQAERERDAAVAKTRSGCFTPMTETFDGIKIDDERGLPQDGEKRNG